MKNLNVPNLSFKREQSESCFDSAERVINQKLNVPNLRFPEFTGEYEKYNLGELGSTLIGLTYSPADVVSEGGTIVLRSSNIKNGVTNYDDIVRVNKKIKDSIITRTNDILVCARNGSPRLIGKNAILKESDSNITFGAFMMIYRSNDNTYIHQLLSTKRFYSQVGENLGARINQITTSDFNSFEFYFPKSKEERIKIASLLALIDKRIETQNKIIEQLQSLIKGIVVSITSGKPNTNISKCLVCKSSTLQENQIEKCGDYPVYGANGVCGYTDKADFDSPAILIVKDGSGVGNVRYVNGDYSVIGTQNILTAQNGYCLKYIFYCLKAFNFVPYKTGMAIPHIYFKDYGKAKIYCPDFVKQVKIVSQIDLVETKIEIETQLLNKYEEQKNFLLSNMFI